MTHQWYYYHKAYSDRTAFVWAVGQVHILPLRMAEALASERVPDLILSYVFTHNMQRTIHPSSTHSNGNGAPLLL
jgi:hypothetical protein